MIVVCNGHVFMDFFVYRGETRRSCCDLHAHGGRIGGGNAGMRSNWSNSFNSRKSYCN